MKRQFATALRLLVFVITVTIAQVSFAQGPGGVTSNLGLWLKANSGPENSSSLPAANGDAISVWRDRSGLSLDYPSVAGPVLITNALNFNAAVQIQAGGFDAPAGAALGTNWTTFFVSKKLSSDNNGRVFEGHTSNYLWAHWGTYTNSIYLNNNPSNYNSGIATTTGIQNLHLHAYRRESVGGTVEARADGVSLATFGTSNSASGIRIDINQGAFAATESSHSQIGEMIVYNSALTSAEIDRIESYLGLKYGLTLSHDYFASNGTTIWNNTTFSGFNTNITGIGRDDNSALNQATSTSSNSGADLTIGATAAFGSDLSFIMMGDNNASNGTSADVPGGYARRLNKVWRSAVTGTPGTVNLSFDLTDLGLPVALAAANYTLLIDNDGVFSSVSSTVAGSSVAAGTVTFNNVNLSDGDYVTIAVLSTALVGPANVTENLKLWLKADAGVTGSSPIVSWSDQAGNGFSATAPGSAPNLLSSQINGNPAVDFTSASTQYLSINSGIFGSSSYSNAWAYVVSKADVIQSQTTFFEPLSGGKALSALVPWSNSNVYFDYGTIGGNGRINGTWGGSINSYNIWTLGSSTGTSTPNGTRKTISRDGQVILSNNNNDSGTGNNQPFLIGAGYSNGLGTSNPFDGKIAEMIIYTGVPTELEQEKIQSYLAVKYGITKSSADIAGTAGQDEQDYFASNGTVIWDYSASSSYHNNVAGIGRDDGSQLSQLSSRSVNSGADVTLTSGGFGTDLSYIVWGDNNASNGTSSDTPTGYARRLNKVWRSHVTGSPGVVSFSIDLTDLGLPVGLPAASYALLIDSDGTFNAGAVIHTNGAALASSQLSFTNVSLSDGDYFTIAVLSTALVGPANVTENLKLWLKADAGVTGSSPIVSWSDQAGNGFSATAPGSAPNLLGSQINGNPAVDFTSASTQYLSINSGIFGSSSYSNAWAYVVSKADVIQSQTTFFEPLSGGKALSALVPWSNSNVYFDYGTIGGNGRINGAWGGSINNYNIWTLGSSTGTSTPNGTRKTISRDGQVILSNNNNDSGTGNNQPFLIGAGYSNGLGTSNPFDGKIAEMIIYTGVPTELEQEKIQSYLAVKYGITKSSADIAGTAGQDEQDYFASNGTVIWDYSANSTYHNRVTGIGRDDGSQLSQLSSLNTASGSLLTLTAPSFSTNNAFIIAGDDNGALSATATGVPSPYTRRVTRIWKTNVTGSPGTISISFDLSTGAHNSGVAADYALLIKNADTDFSAGATVHTTGATIVNNILTFTNVSLSNGDFFSLGLNVTTLGGLQPIFWVKAGSGVTGTTDVSIWADQSGSANNAVQGTLANQPSLVSSDINYNPSINFSGNTDIMTPSSAPANLNSTIFTVAVPSVNTSWRTMFRGSVGDHPLIVQNGGTALGYYDNDVNSFKTSGFTWLQNEAAVVGLEMRTGDVNFRKNGSQGASIATIDLTGLNLNYFGNYQGNGQPFGRIAETLIFNGSALTSAEKERIESYLALKYGVSLTHSYYTSAGALLWDATANASYSNRIIGIGRDDGFALDQRKSKSVHSTSVLTIEKSNQATQFSTNLDILIVGDDNGLLGATVNNVHPSYPMRVSRIWTTFATGAPGTLTISFDLGSGIYNTGNAADYGIIIKNGNSTFSSGASVHTGGASLVGNVLSFTNVSLNQGDYFTLALPRIASPGGTIDNLRLWLKADAGVTGGSNASAWADQTGYYFSATQATAANQPTVLTNRVNFNPALQFDGSNDQLTITSGIMGTSTYSDINIFAVTRTNTIQNSSIFFETQASSGRINAHIPWSDNSLYWDAGSATAPHRLNINWGGATSTPYLWSLLASTTSTALSANQNIVRNGRSISSDATMGTFTGNSSNFNIGVNVSSNFYNGEISELITYTGTLSVAQYGSIQSYLAVKYGITLDQTTATNYVASNGTVLWDATANSTYRFDIAGIGRDDGSALSQPKSKSVNTASIVTIDKGAAFTSDLDFIIWGNDNVYNSPTNVGKHPSYPYRLGRTWRVDVTGAPGAVAVSFDLNNGIYNSGNVGDYALLVHSSNDFTGGSAFTIGATLVAGVITFPNITLNDGAYFTLGMPTPPAPGGVVNNMGIWVKADLGVTGGANASQWNDQSGNNFNLSQSTGANQPAVVTNRHNYNPSIQFDGSNDNLSLSSGIIGTNTLTDVYAFGVTRTNTIGGSYTFYEAVTSGQFDVRTPWSDNTLYWEPGNTGTNRVSANTWSAATAIPFLWGLTSSTTATPSGQKQDIFRNGFSIASDATMNAFTGNSSAFYLGSGPNTNYYNGEVSELVIYRGALTATMLQQVQSYMAIKYGITLNSLNYVNSSGTTIYGTTTTHASYARDIAGIGRDDNSALSQTKSKSVNSNQDLITIANSDFTTPTSFASNNEFLIWGHNGQPTIADPNAASITHGGTTIVRQMVRTWSFQKTGTPSGNLVMEVDMSTVIGPSGFGTNNTGNIRLLIDGDATFGNASSGELTVNSSSVSGNKIYFTVAYSSIPTGQSYFSIGSVDATTASMTLPTPGGVIGDFRLWLKADAGVTGTTPISAWADQSSNAFTAAPTGNSPDLLATQINNNPAIDFTRSNTEFLQITNGITALAQYNDMWTFVVSQTDLTATTNTLTYEATAGSEAYSILLPWSDANTYFDYGVVSGTGRLNGNWGGTFGTTNLWTFGSSTSTATPNGTRKTIARDGSVILSNNNNDGIMGGNQNYLIGGGYNIGSGTSNPFDGRIAELIVFGEIPTPLEQEKIQSYLAIKYGLHKNSADVASTVGQDERDYFASDGTVIWDYSVNTTYSNRIAGIGRDDATALSQIKSQNNNYYSLVSMDKGASFLTDKTYLLWGSDNALLSLTNLGTHASLPYRIKRIWRVDTNGSPGSVNVSFDLSSAIYNSGNANDYRLLVGTSNASFSSASATIGTFAGNVLTFSGITFNDGDYFTLGVANMPAPGGVVPDLHYWLKADQGVTGATNASAWTDQSGNSFIVSQSTAANQPAILTSRSNFNNAIQFDGTNDQLTLTGGIMGTFTYTDFNVFAIARTNTVTASSMFFETQASAGRINVHPPWSDNNLYWDAGGSGGNQRLSGAWGGTAATNYLWGFGASTTATASGVRQDIYRNGRRIFNDNTMTSFTGNGSTLNVGSSGGGNYYNGEIAELVFYSGALTNSQWQRIQSYMAIRHGITLDQTTATSYYASDWNGTTGTVIWNGSTAGLFKNDITVIGRDDNSGLSQKQSASINSGNILTIGNGSIATDNTSNTNSFGANMSFLAWAHNGLQVKAGTLLDYQAPIQARIARVWQATETGTVGTVKVRFNLSTVRGAGNIVGNNELANVRLLVDADGVFASGATIVSPTTFDNSTDIIEFDHDFVAGTGFYFTVASVDAATAPLPIILKSFTGIATPEGTQLKWTTSTEINNDYFEVQVSQDATQWNTLAQVDGKGTSYVENKYELLDPSPYFGKSYYRLKQVDFDGTANYSKMISVEYNNGNNRVYPNPTQGEVTVLADDALGAIRLVTITDSHGIEVYSAKLSDKVVSNKAIDLRDIAAGVYQVHITYERGKVVERLIIIR